jgi:hypothetical protein
MAATWACWSTSPSSPTPPAPGSLLVVGRSALLDARVRQPDGRAVCDLLIGTPTVAVRPRVPGGGAARLAGHRLAHPGIDIDGVAEAVVQLARHGQVRARWYHELSAWDATALGRPAMTYVRAELRDRLSAWLAEQFMRWLHPPADRAPTTSRCSWVARG